jgi:hypothetical protein
VPRAQQGDGLTAEPGEAAAAAGEAAAAVARLQGMPQMRPASSWRMTVRLASQLSRADVSAQMRVPSSKM